MVHVLLNHLKVWKKICTNLKAFKHLGTFTSKKYMVHTHTHTHTHSIYTINHQCHLMAAWAPSAIVATGDHPHPVLAPPQTWRNLRWEDLVAGMMLVKSTKKASTVSGYPKLHIQHSLTFNGCNVSISEGKLGACSSGNIPTVPLWSHEHHM